MTLAERRYYQIAIGLSILLHAALFLIAFPQTLGFGKGSGDQMDTVTAGLMDFSGTSNSEPAPEGTANEAIEEMVSEAAVVTEPEQPKPEVKTEHEPQIIQQEKVTQPKKTAPPKIEPVQQPKVQPKQENAKTVKPFASLAPASQNAKEKNGKPEGTPGGKGEGNGAGKGTNTGNGTGGGNGDKGGGGRGLGTGDSMVAASGLELPLYYPKNAFNENKEGDVRLRILITPDGKLENIEFHSSSGDLRLDRAAENYVKRLSFKKNNEKYYIDLLIMFRVQNETPIIKWLEAKTRP